MTKTFAPKILFGGKNHLFDEELDDLELSIVGGEVERGAAVHRRVHVEAGRRGQLADAV